MRTITSITSKDTITNTLVNQVMEGSDYPYYYSVITFGYFDNLGVKLPPSIIRKFWDKEETIKTARRLHRALHETFNMDGIWTFCERHEDQLDEYDDVLSKGRFHLNIISSNIKDHIIEEPKYKVKRLMYDENRMNIPIKDMVYNDLDDLKIALIDACIMRASDWVNQYQHSIKTQLLEEPIDLDNTIRYCLKEYVKGKTDFTDVVLFKASDLYKP